MKVLLLILLLGQYNGVKPMLGRQIDFSHQLGDPVAFWLMNEGTGNKVYDLSGNGNTGTITNPDWQALKFGSGLVFDKSDYVTVSNQSLKDVFDAGKSWSVVTWVRLDVKGASGWQWIWCKAFTSHVSPYYQVDLLFEEDQNKFQAIMWRSDDFDQYLQTDSAITLALNTWYQVVVVYDASADSLSMYIDGVFSSVDTTSIGTYTNTSSNYGIGANLNAVSDNYDLQGAIDHQLIYNRALTAQEIQQLYIEPFCMFTEDLPAQKMFTFAAVVATPYYYRSYIIVPFIPFGIYLWRRKRCAA
jgi:hypothetical protein